MEEKHDRLISRRKEMGLTQTKIAEILGIFQTRYAAIENLNFNPIDRMTGDWKSLALNISDIVDMDVSLLWANEAKIINNHKKDVHTYLVEESYAEQETPFKHVFLEQLTKYSDRALKTLGAREEYVLKMKFGFYHGRDVSNVEIANILDCTPDNIRCIEHMALRKLRHPSRSKYLKQFMSDYELKLGDFVDPEQQHTLKYNQQIKLLKEWEKERKEWEKEREEQQKFYYRECKDRYEKQQKRQEIMERKRKKELERKRKKELERKQEEEKLRRKKGYRIGAKAKLVNWREKKLKLFS